MRRSVVVILLILLAVPASVVAQPASPAASPAASPSAATGDFAGRVDIGGGRSLYLECHGEGGPVVVLEAGGNETTRDWGRLPDAVGEFTRVCAYDRPNVGGRSDPQPEITTAADVVADLHALLTAAGVPGPYVLVGHSIGGPFIWLYAAAYPDDVAGLVFIDAPVGFRALSATMVWEPERQGLRERVSGDNEDRIDLLTSDQQALAANPPPVPAVVLAHGQDIFPPIGPIEDIEAAWRAILKMNAVALGARFVVAEHSGHVIWRDQPDLVIGAIRDVVAAVRDPTTWATPEATPAGG